MDIDWDNAPKGATHYYTANEHWYKKTASDLFCWWPCGDWKRSTLRNLPNSIYTIPRPTKPAAPEWDGKTWPIPVGAQVEVRDRVRQKWTDQYIVAHHVNGEEVIFSASMNGGALYYGTENDFRPIRSKEQKKRDSLLDALEGPFDHMMLTTRMKVSIVDAILEKYELTERD